MVFDNGVHNFEISFRRLKNNPRVNNRAYIYIVHALFPVLFNKLND